MRATPFHFHDLTASIRDRMLVRIDRDLRDGSLFLSNRLTPEGKAIWPELLRMAAEHFDSDWLAETSKPLFPRTEGAGWAKRRMACDAPECLADGEFNKYYVLAVCDEAVQRDCRVVVYRGKVRQAPRAQSDLLTGAILDPRKVLEDMKRPPHVRTFGQPNSGITIRLERPAAEPARKGEKVLPIRKATVEKA